MATPNLKLAVAELIAHGPEGQTFRQPFVDGQVTRLGRSPVSGWAVSWDRGISREHVDLCWNDGKLTVVCRPTAANPIKLRGVALREAVVEKSEAFEIGTTSFYVSVTYRDPTPEERKTSNSSLRLSTAHNLPIPQRLEASHGVMETRDDLADILVEQSYKPSELKVVFGDAERQMEVLLRLPQSISGAQSDAELANVLCGVILEAIPPATAVAVAMFEESDVQHMQRAFNDPSEAIPKPKVMRVQKERNPRLVSCPAGDCFARPS